MKIRNHMKVAALAGSVVCLLLTGCQKEELVTPSGVPMNNSTTVTNDTPNMNVDSHTSKTSNAQWTTGDAIPVLPPTALNGRWQLSTLNGRLLRTAGMDVPWLVIHIDPNAGGHGTVNGSGGCNRIRGLVFQEDIRLTFTDLGRTRMYCAATHDLEEEFFNALRSTDRFEEIGPQLRLLSGNSELAVLLRVNVAPPEVAVR